MRESCVDGGAEAFFPVRGESEAIYISLVIVHAWRRLRYCTGDIRSPAALSHIKEVHWMWFQRAVRSDMLDNFVGRKPKVICYVLAVASSPTSLGAEDRYSGIGVMSFASYPGERCFSPLRL